MSKHFVGNLSNQATEEDLRELFQQAGTVQSVAARAVEQLNGRVFRDRNPVFDQARSQAGGPGGGRPPSRGPRDDRRGPGGGGRSPFRR
jgi:RNA recognition motif-containing protein